MADGSGLFPPREAQRSADLLTLVAWFNRLRLRAAVGVIVMTAAGSLLGVVDDPYSEAVVARTVDLDNLD